MREKLKKVLNEVGGSRQVVVLGWGGERLEKASVSRRSFGAGKDGRRCGEEFAFLVRLKRKGTVRAKSKRGRKAEETTRGRELAECRNFGRKRERLPAAHRRAGVEMVVGGVPFLNNFLT